MSTEKTASDTLANLNNFVYKNKGDNEVVSLVKSIKSQLSLVTTLATSPDNDFKDVQANGYRTAVRSVSKLVEAAVDSHELAYLRFAELYFKWVLVCASNNNALEPLVGDQVYEFMADYRSRREDLKIVLGVFPAKLYDDFWGSIGELLPNVASVHLVNGFWSLIKWTLSMSYRSDLLAKALMDTDIRYFKKCIQLPEYKIFQAIMSVFRKKRYANVQIDEICPELKSRWTIKVDKATVSLEEGATDTAPSTKVRCKVYSSKLGPIKKTKLVFHVHGGGCLGLSVETFEGNLLPYAERLADTIIVSVDYSLVPETKFPTQVQQILDIYLWATSSSCPLFPDGLESVVVTGDSAGGNLTAALVTVLVDIRSQWSPRHLVMPSAIVSIYPVFTTALEFYPSMLMSTLDTFIPPNGIVSLVSNYGPLDMKLVAADFANKATDRIEGVLDMKQLLKHPYASPLNGDLEKSKDIKLSIVTTSCCSFLDQSVLMAKRWRGPVTLDVFDGLAHGFMQTADVCDKDMVAFNRVVMRISEGLKFEANSAN